MTEKPLEEEVTRLERAFDTAYWEENDPDVKVLRRLIADWRARGEQIRAVTKILELTNRMHDGDESARDELLILRALMVSK